MMTCPCGKPEKRVKVTLVFKRAELLYDAANYSFVEGEMIAEGDECKRHQVIDITQDGNVDRVTRVLNTAHAECVEALYPWTKEEVAGDDAGADVAVTLDDVLREPEEYVVTLWLPEGFSMTTVRLVKELIHEYLVCRVVADWMSITNGDSEGKWEKKFSTLREKIKTALMSRRGKVRRKLKPF